MANEILWIGGTSSVQQLDTQTFGGTWNVDGDVTYTLTDPDDTSVTQTEVKTVTQSAATDVRDEVLAQLQASTKTLFQEITWASSGSVDITATAKTKGRPFLLAATEDDTGGTLGDVETTASAGPNDLGIAANWSPAAVPSVAGSRVSCVPNPTDGKSYSMLWNLDQDAVALNRLSTSKAFKGRLGRREDGKPLRYDVSNGTDPRVTLGGDSPSVDLHVTTDSVNITRTSSRSDAVRIDGDVGAIRVMGSGCRGYVTAATGMVLDEAYMLGAPGRLIIESGITSLDVVRISSGMLDCSSILQSNGTYEQSGGQGWWRASDTGTLRTWTISSGMLHITGDGTMALLTIYGGQVSFLSSEAATKTITNANVYRGGVLDAASAPVTLTFSNPVSNYGGIIKGEVSTSELE